MKLDPQIQTALNNQINREMAAAYNYMAMTAHFERMNLKGFAHWTWVQREEELAHAKKIFDYLHNRGGAVTLGPVEQPPTEYQTVAQVFAAALEQERTNTRDIHNVMKLAKAADDYATQSFLQWFVDEQVEEEQSVGEALALVELAADDRSALLVLNDQFAKRTAEQ